MSIDYSRQVWLLTKCVLVQSENQETFKTRRPALVKADSKLARLLSRFKQGS